MGRRKLFKAPLNVSIPVPMIETLDEWADQCKTTRTTILEWIIHRIGWDEALLDLFFGEEPPEGYYKAVRVGLEKGKETVQE